MTRKQRAASAGWPPNAVGSSSRRLVLVVRGSVRLLPHQVGERYLQPFGPASGLTVFCDVGARACTRSCGSTPPVPGAGWHGWAPAASLAGVPREARGHCSFSFLLPGTSMLVDGPAASCQLSGSRVMRQSTSRAVLGWRAKAWGSAVFYAMLPMMSGRPGANLIRAAANPATTEQGREPPRVT